MAIRSRLTGSASASTSHDIPLPGSAQNGDRVVVGFVNDHAHATAAESTGWTVLRTQPQGTGTNHRLTVVTRVLNGSASDDLTFTITDATHANAVAATWVVICLQGNGGNPVALPATLPNGPDATTGTVTAVTGLASGAYDSIIFLGLDNGPTALSHPVTPPANWGNLQSAGTSSDPALAYSMDRSQLSTTGFSPANVTWTNVDQWITAHVVVPAIAFSTITGTASATLGGLAVSATGARVAVGTATAALGGLVASAEGTAEPVTHVSADAGDVEVEGLPVALTRYLPPTDLGDVEVEGLPIRVSHVVPLDPVDITVEALPATMLSTTLGAGVVEVEGLPIQVSYGSRGIGGRAGLVAIPPAPTTRFIVQSILTGDFLHWDLPLADPSITYELSGPTAITGHLRPEDPELVDLITSGMEPWSCWIHVETDGLIRASAILQPYQLDGEEYALEAVGPSAYPHGMPYLGELSGIAIDPADVVREIWAHLQSYPDGQLGVTVHGVTPVRIGEPEPEEGVEYEEDERPAGPYKLSWWEGVDCGSEVDNLAREVGFDYVERCAWNADRSGVDHWIDLAYPRVGARRDDLRFATGENIIGNPIPAEESDDLYASQVVLFGKGEGRDLVRGYAGRTLRTRLRRVAVIQDRTVATAARANALAKADIERRQGLLDITDIEVDARHDNARFGSYSVGDDILIDVEIPWQGRVQQWERVLSITYSPDAESVRLQLRRADADWYGGQAT